MNTTPDLADRPEPQTLQTKETTMKTFTTWAMALGGAVLLGSSVLAQTTDDGHAEHHPDTAEPAAEAEAPTGDGPALPGMGMMTPEMMQMMHGMMMGAGNPSGMMACPGMQGGPASMAMPGIAGQTPQGPQAFLFGAPLDAPEEMTVDRVRALLEDELAMLGNPRLKLGDISAADDGSIIAEILTVDDSLVQKLAFNRYPGLVRQID